MTRIEKIEKLKKLHEDKKYSFSIPDNCPGDGWNGRLTKNGVYFYSAHSDDFCDDFVSYNEASDEFIDTILDEGEFD